MDLMAGILRAEVDFARDFSNVVERPWGIFFSNPEIPDSHDSNHACILDLQADLPAVIAEIVDFYRSRDLTPRLYHHAADDSGQALRSAMAASGFVLRDHCVPFLIRQRQSTIVPGAAVSVRRVTHLTPQLCGLIERSDSIRARKVIERRLVHPTYHLLVGLVDDQPTSMAALQDLGELTRIDDVLTDVPHRGRGYARAVMADAVDYHARNLRNTLYLFTDNPTAERIYREAGFVDMQIPLRAWSAAMEIASRGTNEVTTSC